MDRQSLILKWAFRVPSALYRFGLGWVLGRRFLVVTHRGRKTGRLRQTVLEVLSFDSTKGESVVASAYGSDADWYQNLQSENARRVRTGRMDYVPEQRMLTVEEARKVAVEFCGRHRWEARLIPRVLRAIGARMPSDPSQDPVALLASLPMVAFRPRPSE